MRHAGQLMLACPACRPGGSDGRAGPAYRAAARPWARGRCRARAAGPCARRTGPRGKQLAAGRGPGADRLVASLDRRGRAADSPLPGSQVSGCGSVGQDGIGRRSPPAVRARSRCSQNCP